MTPVGAPVAERVGARFDGAADCLARSEADWRSGDSQGTILALVRVDAAHDGAIFASCDEGGNQNLFYLAVTLNLGLHIYAKIGGLMNRVNSPDDSLAVGVWHRVALVSTGTAWLLYIDGSPKTLTPVGAEANTGDWLADVPLRDNVTIGARWYNIIDTYFNGQIKDVIYYSRELSADEILYDYRQCVPDDFLRLWTVGGMTDLSRFVRTPTHLGGVICGHEAHLDGIDDRIDWGDLGNIQAISLWLDPETTTEEILLIDAGKDIMVDGGVVTYTGLVGVATYVDGAGTTLVADKWQHLVCVFERVDANNFEQGWDGANYGNTEQNDLRVYDRIPSADEVRLMYSTEKRSH